MEKKYIISKKRLEELLEEEDKLCRLENAGVDNWEGYEYAFEDEYEDEDESYIDRNFEEYKGE